MNKQYCWRCLFYISFFLLYPCFVVAQEERELAPVTRTYAIKNVHLVQAPGKRFEKGTIVLKDGLIEAVGVNVSIPANAIIIEEDSLFVYAGFIDGFSYVGVNKPTTENKEKVKDPGNPPPDRAGITPDVDVRNHLNPSDKSIEELRSVGFTSAHVVPYGRMLPGKGATILLAGSTVDKMILTSQSSFYSTFTGAERVYPNTVIGVIAKWRELYLQAKQAKSYETLYASNRNGLLRPVTSRILESFYPVVDKKMPVFFNTPKILDAHRALKLQSELDFSLVLGDLKEGWDLLPLIKSSDTKVFLSLELPEEKKEEKKEPEKEDMTKSSAEKTALEKRKKQFVDQYTSQPVSFQKQGLIFGFSTMTVKTKDIQPNLRRMIKAGLTEDQALAALTIHPAQLLGLSDRLGTLEKGKMANVVVSHKPYFDEKANVRYVFVDGNLHKVDNTKKPKTEIKVPLEIAGGWTVVIETPQGKSEETLTIKKENDSYTGVISGGQLPAPVELQSITLEGNNLKYKYTVEFTGQIYNVEVDAVIEAETFKGTASMGQYGNFSVEGKKEPKR